MYIWKKGMSFVTKTRTRMELFLQRQKTFIFIIIIFWHFWGNFEKHFWVSLFPFFSLLSFLFCQPEVWSLTFLLASVRAFTINHVFIKFPFFFYFFRIFIISADHHVFVAMATGFILSYPFYPHICILGIIWWFLCIPVML